ncbi:MAG: UDP-N-acetylmuramoyl-L-alanyl-D-glutamate--2,6-diaminopimelate ligase [Chitinophagaceae bacterium]|nr:MAG: UDP-N-acetylmuramoyl-L-alanyl-D-glutamate--2,6-diaminopimelate ligase [Chitinophagaceae bacterium]
MMLKDLLYKVSIQSVSGSTSVEVKDLQLDSRMVTPGCCFIAMKGVVTDGHDYITEAVKRGATSVICETLPESLTDGVTYVAVLNPAIACGQIAHRFFNEPTLRVKLVGVTGTNGKTTVATLLYKLFSALDHSCGLISTVENIIAGKVIPATHTTPDAISLNRLLKKMEDAGCEYVFMECSSHAIQQSRIEGLNFTGAIFTNITHDHLDYHKTFNEYIRVKKSWFDGLPKTAFAISNADDKRGQVMLQNTSAKTYLYGLKTMVDFKAKILDNSLSGLHLIIDEADVHFKIAGEFNAYNILAVYAAAVLLGEDKQQVLVQLSALSGAEGRFEITTASKSKVVGIIDYAHTPDALLNVLATINHLRKGNEKVITVVGCGGNRDRAKRPVMAQVACEHSDKVIFTSDNPRNEEPMDILKEMEAGVNVVSRKKYITIPDRREAIKAAVNLSDGEDIILLAGKGHEKYQEIGGVKYDFDDREVLEEMFALLEK